MAVDTADSGTAQHARSTVRPDKAAAVAQIADAFRRSAASVLTEYRGLSVAEISELRVALGADTTYTVVKNTLTKIAAADAGVPGVDKLLQGPTAVAFISGEPVVAAKALRDFAKAHPVLVVKGGVMDGKALTVEEIRQLADLESREVLLAKMAGALLASLSNAVYLFNAPLAQVARLAGALQAKAEADPSVLSGGASTSAAPEAAAPEAAAPEAAAPEAAAPEAAAPEAAAPEVGAPQAAAPEVGAPQAVGPEAAAAEVEAAEVEASAPDAAAPDAAAPDAAAPDVESADTNTA